VCCMNLHLQYRPGASIPIPWWRRCATSEIGGKGFLGPWGGRTKNIDVLMIVMLKLANGFSDYEQAPRREDRSLLP